jgi:hypothetical protein
LVFAQLAWEIFHPAFSTRLWARFFPLSPRFETQWAAVSSAGPRKIASSASFWLLLDRIPRLVNPTFNQVLRQLCRYCYEIPSIKLPCLWSRFTGKIFSTKCYLFSI